MTGLLKFLFGFIGAFVISIIVITLGLYIWFEFNTLDSDFADRVFFALFFVYFNIPASIVIGIIGGFMIVSKSK